MHKSGSLNKLIDLIKSLSGPEKRYFKLYTTLHTIGEGNKYVQLFDVIDSQKSLSKSELLQNMSAKQVKDLKLYLYKLLLRSTRAYHNERTNEVKLKEWLIDIELLFQKGLYEQCEALINKAKKLAEELEKFSLLLEILIAQKKLFYVYNSLSLGKADLKKNIEEEKQCLRKLNNLYAYQHLSNQIILYWKEKGVPTKEEEVKKFKSILQHQLLCTPNKALSYRAKNLYYGFFIMYYESQNNLKQVSKFSYLRLKLMYSNLTLFHEEPLMALNIIYHHVDSCIRLKKFKEASIHLEQLKKIPSAYSSTREVILADYFRFKQTLLLASCKFEEAEILIQEIKKWLTKLNKDSIMEFFQSDFYYFSSYNYFILGQFDKALAHLNKLLNNKFYKPSDQFLAFLKTIQLVYLYEAKKESMLEYQLRSTSRFLQQKNHTPGLENQIANFIDQSTKTQSKKELKSISKKFKIKLQPLLNSPLEGRTFTPFNFIAWLDSKILDRSFKEILKSELPYGEK